MVEKKGFTNIVLKSGTISTLYGLPGSGKTNLMVFLSEQAALKGYSVWSIIHYFHMSDVGEAIREGLLPPGINYIPVPPTVATVKRVSDLLLGVLGSKKNATILDEAGIFASTRSPMAKKLRYILNLSYIIRHLRSSFVYITQTDRSIPPEMRESLVSYEMNIRKQDSGMRVLNVKKRKEYVDRFGNEQINFVSIDHIKNIPLTRLPWDGHYIPKFEFDIDLDEAWNRLGEYDSLEVRKVGKGIIRDMVDEKKAVKEEEEDRETPNERNERALKRYEEMLENGEVTTKYQAAGFLSSEFNLSTSWAYQLICGYKKK